jgi:hypothetical protein
MVLPSPRQVSGHVAMYATSTQFSFCLENRNVGFKSHIKGQAVPVCRLITIQFPIGKTRDRQKPFLFLLS